MREILGTFLKIGATAYGGPAIMGVMQAEFQERRQWLTKAQFVEGLAFANMLPGATATQLGIFLGYRRAGWWGGLLAGLCFCAPAFAIMLALTLAYPRSASAPAARRAVWSGSDRARGVRRRGVPARHTALQRRRTSFRGRRGGGGALRARRPCGSCSSRAASAVHIP
jgi:hypothetical protein